MDLPGTSRVELPVRLAVKNFVNFFVRSKIKRAAHLQYAVEPVVDLGFDFDQRLRALAARFD